jgi:hypothetical protein
MNKEIEFLLSDIHKIILLESLGRLLMLLFFKQNLCVINLHAGHNGDINELENYVKNTLNDNRCYLNR